MGITFKVSGIVALAILLFCGCAKQVIIVPKYAPGPAPNYNDLPMGILGCPVGTYLTIEGLRSDGNKTGNQTLLVDTVNGVKLDTPRGLWIQNVGTLPQQTRCVFNGYETAYMIGVPFGPGTAERLPVPQAMWQLRRTFIVTSIPSEDQPKKIQPVTANPSVDEQAYLHPRRRVLTDLDGDGDDDMILSEPVNKGSVWGTMGGKWDVLFNENGKYVKAGGLWMHLNAFSIEPDESRNYAQEAERKYARIWVYLKSSGSSGSFGYYRIAKNGVSDLNKLKIHPGDGGTELGNALYDAMVENSPIPYVIEMSRVLDGKVVWEEDGWVYNEAPLAEPGNYIHRNYYRSNIIDELPKKLSECKKGMSQDDFCDYTGLERIHRHINSHSNITETEVTITYDLPELHEDGIRFRERYTLEIVWTYEKNNKDNRRFHSGRLIPIEK